MSTGTANILSTSSGLALAVFGAALALLVIWHDARRRSNQYFALCMMIFSSYGVLNTIWHVSPAFDLEPEPAMYAATTVYIVGLILLFNFVISFVELPRRIQQVEHWISVPLGLGFVILLWTDQLFTDFKRGSYDYSVTPTAVMGGIIALVYIASSTVLLYRRRSPKRGPLLLATGMVLVGLVIFLAVPVLRRYSVNALAMTICMVLLGRLVIVHQVFQPLADLNGQLIEKNKQLVEATRLKSQFLANMSHELRTPLNSIIGYTELVENGTYGDLNATQQDRLAKVGRNGRLLLDLINDVLDLSKIEAGRLNLDIVQVPMVELLDNLLDSIEPRVLEKGLKLVRGYSNLPAVLADENRARQILSNLLSNAIKFTEQGVVIVRGHYDETRQQVVISITDTGIGIDPKHQEHIFEAFHQADSTLTRKYEGTGLGLTISYRLCELHGGRIWFNSAVGRGSTFHVALPAAEETPQAAPTVHPGLRAKGPLILSIDDDIEAIEVLQGHLEANGFRVQGICNSNDGIRLAHDLKPALITLDVRMPNTNGWAVFEALRRDPDTANIPVLVISATDDRDVAQVVGVDGFMRKPVRPQALISQIHRLLAKQEVHA
ncbi:MAG TPA: ATP-binding protein [Aggregatilineaceae bacterium]|nr:ATP-binding protein [Aggregatilineaceae bacterium]